MTLNEDCGCIPGRALVPGLGKVVSDSFRDKTKTSAPGAADCGGDLVLGHCAGGG